MPATKTSRRSMAYVIVASFLLGSFSGSAFGVLFAVSLNSKYYPWREAPAAAAKVAPVSAEDRQVIEAVQKVAPSVVSIVISKDVSKMYNSTGVFPFEFFGMPQAAPPAQGQKQHIGGGTGFVISSEGLILTNRHVVADAEAEYEVVMSDGRLLPAKVAAVDSVLDIAILKVEAQDLPVAPLGEAAKLETGETVIAIGNALSEYSNSVTKGVISGINRRVIAGDGFGDSEVIEEALQTDAAINPGNSGGPLINLRGEVVGVNTAVNRSGQSIGFAIPIDAVKVVIDSYREQGRIVRPWLGVRYVMLTPDTAKANGLQIDHGALVVGGGQGEGAAIVPGSPAEKAGIKPGDVLLDIDGAALGTEHPLSALISRKRPGAVIAIHLMREKTEMTLQATLAELPATP
ncbi:MAG TPA: trypsin-like peptidase domain-containing protein [Candidatus Baltobacteraceae bacterium]|nr:trypsin-like peptidase domain-containing protein [Candidatus Baltobacteraceae bacterium]